MTKKYALYCSGSASRIIKFYEKFSESTYRVEFILYDGNKIETFDILNELFPSRVYSEVSAMNVSDYLLKLLAENSVDYLFCFGDKILKGQILEEYRNKIINFHPSLLPSFPGLNSIDQALNSSVQIIGNTAHFIDKGVDTGPIIMQSLINRSSYTNYEDVLSLQIRMLEKIWYLLEMDKIQVVNNKVIIEENINFQKFFSI